jgi:predicted unusual protein kinase regulating ubiquinone biosynthesis (AarF/ABC1/UbiB family)
MEWIDAVPITDDAFRKKHGIDDAAVINRLVRSFIWQIRNGQLFHADPHAGNIQIQKDGTLVFLDFGMVGRIREESRTAMIRFIQSIIVRDQKRMTESLQQLGFIREGADIVRLQHALDELIDFFLDHRTDLWNDQLVQDVLGQFRYFVNQQPIQMPAEFAFFGRAMGMLVGLVTHLDPSIDYLDLGKKILPDLKITEDIPVDFIGQWLGKLSGLVPVSLMQIIREWVDLPGNVNQFFVKQNQQKQFEQHRQGLLLKIRYAKQMQFLGLLGLAGVGYVVYKQHVAWQWLFLPGGVLAILHMQIMNYFNHYMKGGHIHGK